MTMVSDEDDADGEYGRALNKCATLRRCVNRAHSQKYTLVKYS